MADLDARSRIVDHLARLTALASSARGRRAGDAAAVAVEALASDARSLATAAGELERAERDLARARRVLSLATSASAGRRRRRNGNGGAGGGRGGDDASSSVGISSPTPRASCAAASAACEWRGACVGRFHRHHAALGRALRHDPHSLPQKEIDAAVEAERDGGRASARELRGGGGGGGGGAGNRRRRQIEFTPGGGIMPRRARYVSPWAKHAANAVHVISDAVDALVGDGGGLVFTIGEGSRSKSKSTSKPSPELALPWLADRVDSVGSVVANWTTHRPKLRPTGVTLSDLCLLHSDVVHVDDALTRAAASFARAAAAARGRGKEGKENDDDDDDIDGCGVAASAATTASARYAIRLALGRLTDVIAREMTTTCDQLWSEAPKGAWRTRGPTTSEKNKNDAVEARQVRPIHWFPYDPVRVVNADP